MQFLRRQRKGRKRKSFLEKIGLHEEIQSVDKLHENYVILNRFNNGAQGIIHNIKPKVNHMEDKKSDQEGNETIFNPELVLKIIDLQDIDDIEQELICALNKYKVTSTETLLLNHDGIYYDEREKQIFIVTEKLKSNLAEFKHDLDDSNMKLNEEQLRSMMSDILMKLYVLHKSGYIHCDINPSNVMCDNQNEWKLIDFDMMMKIDDNKGYATDCWKGTIAWVSKEIGQNIHSSDNRFSFSSDLWSFGLILVYILNDFKNPFDLTLNEIEQNKLYHESDKLEYFYKYKMTQIQYQSKLECLLVEWFSCEKISFDLFDLLLNHLLVFDVNQRAQTCLDIIYHPWFYHHIKQNKQKYKFRIDRHTETREY